VEVEFSLLADTRFPGVDSLSQVVDGSAQDGYLLFRRLPGLGISGLQLQDKTQVAQGESLVGDPVQDRLEGPLGVPVLTAQKMQNAQPVVEGGVEREPLYQQLLDLLGAHVPAPEEHQVHAPIGCLLDEGIGHLGHGQDFGEGVDGLLKQLVGPLLPGERVLGLRLDQLSAGRVGGERLALGNHLLWHLVYVLLQSVQQRLQFGVDRVFVIVVVFFFVSATI